MKHLDKFDDFIKAHEEQLSLLIKLKDAVEYGKCLYSINTIRDRSNYFVLIRKSDKKQLTSGVPAEIKKYIKNTDIKFEEVFDIDKIGISIDKPELSKYEDLIKKGEESVNLTKDLKRSWMLKNMAYMIKRDKYFYNKFALIDLKTGYYVLKCDTAVEILKHIDRKGIESESIYDYDLIKKKY